MARKGRDTLAKQWKSIKHKFTDDEHAAIKREAHAELERIGFGKLRQARQQTQVAVADRLKIISVPDEDDEALREYLDHRGYNYTLLKDAE
jgi:hypothetical protein